MHLHSREELRRLMVEEGLTQTELARRAHISQSTVSRALKTEGQRQGKARFRLFKYAYGQRLGDARTAQETERQVLTEFLRVWDGTQAHAAVIVRVIHALAGLGARRKRARVKLREGERRPFKATAKKYRSE